MSTTPGEPGDIPALPEKPMRNRTALITWIAVAAVVVVGAVVLIVNLTRSSDSADRVTVKIGTTEASADYWPILIKLAPRRASTSRPSTSATT